MGAKLGSSVFLAILVLVLAAGPAAGASTTQYLYGDVDGFAYSPGAPDDPYVTPALWAAAYSPTVPRSPFDTLTPGCTVPFSVGYGTAVPCYGPGGPATLTLALRATDPAGVAGDSISFFNDDCTLRVDYTFDQLGWLPLPDSGTTLCQVDLGAAVNPHMEVNGWLNVLVGTHTAVDYAILETVVYHWPRNDYGDANSDWQIDLQDFGILKDHFGTTLGANYTTGDFNHDGAVDLQDFGILKDNFGLTPGDPLTAIPEPVSLLILLSSPIVLCRIRPRR